MVKPGGAIAIYPWDGSGFSITHEEGSNRREIGLREAEVMDSLRDRFRYRSRLWQILPTPIKELGKYLYVVKK